MLMSEFVLGFTFELIFTNSNHPLEEYMDNNSALVATCGEAFVTVQNVSRFFHCSLRIETLPHPNPTSSPMYL